jgi:hypothetical protein
MKSELSEPVDAIYSASASAYVVSRFWKTKSELAVVIVSIRVAVINSKPIPSGAIEPDSSKRNLT